MSIYDLLVFFLPRYSSIPELLEPETSQYLGKLSPKQDCGTSTNMVNKEMHTYDHSPATMCDVYIKSNQVPGVIFQE